MGGSLTPSIICPTVIGRAGHLATLRLLVEQAKQGQRHVVLLSGEAGIGKSRLVVEAKTYAATQSFLVLQGSCFPTDITYPYAPLLDLLRSLLTSTSSSALIAAIKTLARDVFPLLPELVPHPTMPLAHLEPEQEKRRLFAILSTFFLHLATQSPVLFILEDIHWSDDTSLDFLHSFVRHALSRPILFLLTYRHDEIRPGLQSWLAHIDRERLAQELRLTPLSRSDIDMMLMAIFNQQHTSLDMRRFLHGELLDTLYTLTEGNPFFCEEIMNSLVMAGDILYTQGYWNRRIGREFSIPRSVQDAVQQRTARIGEAARYVLTLAAVAGRHFDFTLLQKLTHYGEQQLLLLMKELVSAQLVVEESAEQFAFRHALTRQSIYTQLLTRERRILHQTIAETMEHQDSTSLNAYLEDLAYHFYQAGIWQKAIDYAQRAGEKALKLYSHRAALDYFTWALEATAHLSLPPAPRLYQARGRAYEAIGEFEQAQHDYSQALNAARTAQDRTIQWQSTIDLGFLWAGRDYTRAETWFRQALILAQTLDNPILNARSLNRIGNWHLNVEQPNEAMRYHREALAIFEQFHDEPGIAETLDLLGMTSYLAGDLIQGTAYYYQAISLFRKLKDQQGLTSSQATMTLRGPTFQTDSLVSVASLAEVRKDAEHALNIAREIGHRAAEAYALFQLGLCLGSQGEYGQALVAAQQSLDIAEAIEHHQWQAAAHFVLGGIYSGLLAYSQAHEQCEQALVLAHETSSLLWTRIATGCLASTLISRQHLAQAETLLHAAPPPDTPAQTMTQRIIRCASVELALAQGHPSQALEIIERLTISTTQGDEGRNSLRLLKLRGEALVALQQVAEAEAAFKQAQEIAEMQGVRPMYWRICVALGNLYQKQGRTTEAEQAFATARTVIEVLATTIPDEVPRKHFLQQAMSMCAQTPPSSPSRNVKQASGGLTAREREVTTLIAQGKSNQTIANTLVVSKRTVETHISNIMFKLDCTARTQIAVWAVEAGLVSQAETENL